VCGRFLLATPMRAIAELFGIQEADILPEWKPRYNIAPMQMVPVIREWEKEGARRRTLSLVRWGLVPIWADDPAIGNRMINARAETIASKPAFRQAFSQRRCIIPADGFYEWKKIGPRAKQPMAIVGADRQPLSMAGLWERWRSKDEPGEWLETCTVLTCEPNELLREVHDRMPVILARQDVDRWLDPAAEGNSVRDLLRPLPSERMMMFPVARHVNTPAHDDARCFEPLAQEEPPPEEQGRLF
jgi:putative SOS response-associated peptidase YedK